MNEPPEQSRRQQPMSRRERVDQACDRFEQQWRAKQNPRIEDLLERAKRDDREHLLRELLALEMWLRQDNGQNVDPQQYRHRFVADAPVVESALEFFYQRLAATHSLDSTIDRRFDEEAHAAAQHPVLDEEIPAAIDRYKILRRLGRGGFAVVYLAHDTQLDRQVALKVPRLDRFDSHEVLDLFVQEARNSAQLDHPGIVRVYDVQSEPGLVYIVQQYIAGGDLAAHVKFNQLSSQRIAELVIAVAEAVGYAHEQGCWHRDLKPANLLMDTNGRPFVADFGLSLHESIQRDRAGEVAGTSDYMSPEQVRGEAHRLDGRSDIWSLGVILYELLTGRRPFSGETRRLLEDEILHRDPKPPRMIAPAVPRELARICLACLCKKATDRYQTAADLIDDLRHWLEEEATAKRDLSPSEGDEKPSSQPAVKIVPKGLRSFDAADADFFLELLPGPRDREGLPKRVRFWKTQIEKMVPEETFPVGLMYGPSGCGKSSLVKAGLIPRLSEDVLPVYVEATAEDTEVRLIKALRRNCPDLPVDDSLPELIACLRSSGGWRGRKVLLVLDQFEQWLHAHDSLEDSQLVPALRQCDGGSVQCLVLVRDDFYASLNRFFQQLEVRIVEEHNSALVDLFDPDHARKVLTAIGRAYSKLPDLPVEPSAEQARFLQHAVEGLADDSKVICVRLAVFSEMMKGRPWTDESLREVGGTEGVGVSFLDETFSAKTGPPSHRLHRKAIESVLEALLPEYGSDIKGQMKSYDALWKVSGYVGRPSDFESLLRILDSEVRLITPTEPDELPAGSTDANELDQAKYYQLTHDFLVPSLREWLTRNQRATRRGRMQLLLRELSEEWTLRPDPRRLPTLSELLGICWWSKKSERTAPERRMLRAAVRRTSLRAALVAAGLVLLVFMGHHVNGRFQANALLNRLLNADTSELPYIVAELEPYRRWMMPLLRDKLAARAESLPAASDVSSHREQRQRLHLLVAQAQLDPTSIERVLELIPEVPLEHLGAVTRVLAGHKDRVEPRLWETFRTAVAEKSEAAILPLAAALAQISADSDQWSDYTELVAAHIANARSSNLGQWLALFGPVGDQLARPIVERYVSDVDRGGANRSNLLDATIEYAADNPDLWAAAVETASPGELETLLASSQPQPKPAADELSKRLSALDTALNAIPTAIEPELRKTQETIDDAGGFLDGGAAMVPALSKAAFDSLDQTLRERGFGAACVRPFVRDGTLQLAACWRRDGRSASIRWNLQPSDVDATDQEMRKKNLVMVDFARYRDPEPRLVAVWRESDRPQHDTRIYVDATLEDHQRNDEEWSKQGFAIERFDIQLDQDGVSRCSAIWKKTDVENVSTFADWRYQRAFGDLSPGSLQTDCRVVWLDASERDTLAFHKHLAQALAAAKDTPSDHESDTKMMTAAKYLSAAGQYQEAVKILREMAARRKAALVYEQLGVLYGRAGLAEGLRMAVDDYARFEKQKAGMLDYLRLRAAILSQDVDEISTRLNNLEQLHATDDATVELSARAYALIAPNDALAEQWPMARARSLELLRKVIVEHGIQTPETLVFDVDFDSLRDSEQFAALINELGFHQRYCVAYGQVIDAESRQLFNLAPDEHRRAAIALRQEGFVPHAISVSSDMKSNLMACCSVWHRRVHPVSDTIAVTRQQANLALALARLGQPQEMIERLLNTKSPGIQSHFMTRAPAIVEPTALVQALRDAKPDPDLRSLLLVLGSYDADRFSATDRTLLQARVEKFASADEPGLRSAALWCIAQWGLKLVMQSETPKSPAESPGWYVNPAGQVMIELNPPDKFLMGSPEWEPGRDSSEKLLWARIGQPYALSATETTQQAVQLFLNDENVKKYMYNRTVAPNQNPLTGITWRQAAMFCQWLSERDPEITEEQYCYPAIWDADAKEVELPDNYLVRTGYRLPREMEWEWAARAGCTSSRPSGYDDTVLTGFEWFSPFAGSRAHPVGTRRPNDFGLFDMLGNVHEWCDDLQDVKTRSLDSFIRDDDKGNPHLPNEYDKCVLRGGSYKTGSGELRSANGIWQVADYLSNSVGFRVVRTLPPRE